MFFGAVLFSLFGIICAAEAYSSYLQSRYFAAQAKKMSYSLEPQASENIVFPSTGPLNRRRGYVDIPRQLAQLTSRGYTIAAQASLSPEFLEYLHRGNFSVHDYKPSAGLTITSADNHTLAQHSFPKRYYRHFTEIPGPLIEALLFIENRELLNPQTSYQNPVIEWPRFIKANIDMLFNTVGFSRPVAGASTLATQFEKFQFSPHGETTSAKEKFRQMYSAMMRAYKNGHDTSLARRRIILNYVNSVPFGATKGWGEIHGIQDGLHTWLGEDSRQVNAILRQNFGGLDEAGQRDFARAYRQILTLMIGQQQPVFYFVHNQDALHARVDRYLRLMDGLSLIDKRLSQTALHIPIEIASSKIFRAVDIPTEYSKSDDWKFIYNVLLQLLGVENRYALERLDVQANSTIWAAAQRDVKAILDGLRHPDAAKTFNLNGQRLMGRQDPDNLVVGFSLYERGHDADRLRIQIDNHPGALNIHTGTKLDLGSTAKLRVLVSYLERISQLVQELQPLGMHERGQYRQKYRDDLTKWAENDLKDYPDSDLLDRLERAMLRRYSARPSERFMTGGGSHRFGNASSVHDDGSFTVKVAFRDSINLPFVRLMRDIVSFHIERLPDDISQRLRMGDDALRKQFLERFAVRDAQAYIGKFYDRYINSSSQERLSILMREYPRLRLSEQRYQELVRQLNDAKADLFKRQREDDINPLELWVIDYLNKSPHASRSDCLKASDDIRKASYAWLIWSSEQRIEDRKIGFILEEDAFRTILHDWKKLGYVFDSLVPSYATALGSSADRSDSLAQLVGIVLNKGIKKPILQFESFHFAVGTPYETTLAPIQDSSLSKRVLSQEVASVVHSALIDAAQNGTGKGRHPGARTFDGADLRVGGKTGTGDNRYRIFDRDGNIIHSRTVNRTATWVYSIGECYYGVVLVYVDGAIAKNYTFNSSLAVEIFDQVLPKIEPFIRQSENCIGDG